ncbi:MAG TPA: hypothetical protein DDZ89_14395 [Clostridiales bacterium]|nr:hypothetical protein [Clostridiales bacterium]
MFKEHLKKYRFVFFRSLLAFYPFILMVDALIAERNAWYMELWCYLFCAFIAFAAGIGYEGYYFNRLRQKEYPTRKRFRQVAAIAAVIMIVLLYGLLTPVDEVARRVYTLSRGLVVYPVMEAAFFAREVEKNKIKDILYMVPSFIVTFLLYFVFPQARRIYGNIAMLTLVVHGIFFATYYTDLSARIKQTYGRLKTRGSIGRFLKAWSAFVSKARTLAGDLLMQMRERWKDLTYNFFLVKGFKKLITGIFRFFRRDKETKTERHSDYIDEIDTWFVDEDNADRVRYTVRGLYKIKDPVRKVRYAFGLVMSDLKEKKVGIRYFDTVTVIGEKSKVIKDLDQYMDPLCEMYEHVRYGDRCDEQRSEGAAILAVSADTTIKESYWQPKVYANSDFEFEGSDQN